MTTAYKFRLYPKKEQQDKLDLSLEVCRQTYNHLLSGLDERFTKSELQNYLLDLKVVFPEMNNIHRKKLVQNVHLQSVRIQTHTHKKQKRNIISFKDWRYSNKTS